MICRKLTIGVLVLERALEVELCGAEEQEHGPGRAARFVEHFVDLEPWRLDDDVAVASCVAAPVGAPPRSVFTRTWPTLADSRCDKLPKRSSTTDSHSRRLSARA